MSEGDHESRRRQIAKVALDVITRDGLQAATVRRIAAEAGYSTMIIAYHFANKRDMLLSAYSTMGEDDRVRYDEIAARDPSDLTRFLMSMAAVEPEDIARWRAYIAIWDSALRDPILTAELQARVAQALERIESFVKVLDPSRGDTMAVAKHLYSLVQGISVQRLIDPSTWSKESIAREFSAEVRLLLGSDGVAGTD